jgi:hypothetical protein
MTRREDRIIISSTPVGWQARTEQREFVEVLLESLALRIGDPMPRQSLPGLEPQPAGACFFT